MRADEILWPGVDRDRAVGACWHLTRAVQRRLLAATLPDRPWAMSRAAAMKSALEHSRIARGYLGAVGFERKARL